MSTSFQPAHGKQPSIPRFYHPDVDVAATARQRMLGSPYRAVHDVECEYDEGIMTLRGRVSSYFLKQMAQEAVGKLPGVEEIANHIEVLGLLERAAEMESVGVARPEASRMSVEGQPQSQGSPGRIPR